MIEGSAIATNPNNKLVFGFRQGTLSHQPLDLTVGHATTLSSHEFHLDASVFPNASFATKSKV
jgi:hypothetical protein